MAIYAVDLDGTLTLEEVHWENYLRAKPDHEAIKKINKLWDEGHEVHIYTARPSQDKTVTIKWLLNNGVKFTQIIFDKFRADYYVDNSARRVDEL
jgi:hydroxymethylpyrimidine pyrophosphatase-like HAD family hydrolase